MSLKGVVPKIPGILRPSSGSSGHATMIWVPGVELVELVYQEGELKYAAWDGGSVKYQKFHGNYTPPQWVADAVKKGTVRLLSQATASGGLDDIARRMKSFIHRYFECDEDFENLAVLWTAHTWVSDRFRATPHLRLLCSWGTGKSRATGVIGAISYRPVALTGSSSPAAFYRIIEPIGGTLLIDEADYSDTQVGTEVAKILNSGYEQGGCVWKTKKKLSDRARIKAHVRNWYLSLRANTRTTLEEEPPSPLINNHWHPGVDWPTSREPDPIML